MLEEKVEVQPKRRRNSVFGFSVGMIGLVGVIGIGGIYSQLNQYQTFLEKEVITLEGTVVDERYVQPTAGGESSRSSPSQYFFSIDTIAHERMTIEVMDSYDPKVHLESVDAKLQKGTRVEVKARNIAEGEYKVFANEVYVKKSLNH